MIIAWAGAFIGVSLVAVAVGWGIWHEPTFGIPFQVGLTGALLLAASIALAIFLDTFPGLPW